MKKVTKIAVVGTHGVGKTTVCYKLATELKLLSKNVGMIAEVARTSPLLLNEHACADDQYWIMLTQMARELEASYRNEYIICDRSVLDTLVYYNLSLKRNGTRRYDNDTMAAQSLYFNWIKTYDYLIWVRPHPELRLEDDGVRSIDPAYQKEVDVEIEYHIRKLKETGNRRNPIIEECYPMEMFDEERVHGVLSQFI